MALAPGAYSFPAQNVGDTVFVDNVVGDDTTGQRGRADLPFASLQWANEASLWGDLVYVAHGNGYYDDPVKVACAAGRDYFVEPGVLFSDPTLNAEAVFFSDLTQGTWTSSEWTVVTSTLHPFTMDHVGRELVILGGGTDFTNGRYLIQSVDSSGNATLNGYFATNSAGATGGIGCLSPGPMQTRRFTYIPWPSSPSPMFNGQTDGLLQLLRVADTGRLSTSGSSLVPPVSNTDNIERAYALLMADDATQYANQGPYSGAGASDYVQWYGNSVPASYLVTTATDSNLGGSITGTAPQGACTIIVSTMLVSNFMGTDTTGAFCGQVAGSGNAAYLWWDPAGLPPKIHAYVGSTSNAVSVDVSGATTQWNILSLRQAAYLYPGATDTTEMYLNNEATPTYATFSNVDPLSGDNYLIGFGSSQSHDNIQVAHYVFFDGAVSKAKLYAWINAMRIDLGIASS